MKNLPTTIAAARVIADNMFQTFTPTPRFVEISTDMGDVTSIVFDADLDCWNDMHVAETAARMKAVMS